jgi:hypothetical protein
MENENYITAEEFCKSHQIEVSFISSLHNMGIVEVTTIEETEFIPLSQLQKLEQCVRLFYDLDINIEGIDAISHILERVKSLQAEILHLHNRLRRYESEPGYPL